MNRSSASTEKPSSIGVPPVDLSREYASIAPEIRAKLDRVFRSGRVVLGEEVKEFEKRFAAFVGTRHAVGLASGTDALFLALTAVGVKPGDEVVTVSWTFFATVAAIVRLGARPVLVDIEPRSFTMDADLLEKAITPRTRALLPVHLYGHPADMPRICEIAAKRKIAVVEDAAQAHGAQAAGKNVGQWGTVGCFSFYPTKNLGAYGDAGAVTTDDDALADQVKLLRVHGGSRKYFYDKEVGINSRLDEVQAAILNVKLTHISDWTKARREAAEYYSRALGSLAEKLVLPVSRPGCRHVYHLYTVRAKDRDRLLTHLTGRGIQADVHYPTPAHRQPVFRDADFFTSHLPETDRAAREIINLPIFPQITRDEQDAVIAGIKEFYAS